MAVEKETISQTLAMLEERMQTVQFTVSGDQPMIDSVGSIKSSGSVSASLKAMERNIAALSAKSSTVAEILQLQKRYPELFNSLDYHSAPSTLPLAASTQVVVAHEDLYKASASQLSALNEIKEIPDSGPMANILTMKERIEQIQARQIEQAQEFAELRLRSAKILEHWYESSVLVMGDRWAEWEERLKDCEVFVRRKEAAKRREEETI